MTFRVVFLDRAQKDLDSIYRSIRRSGASQRTAQGYVDGVVQKCDDLCDFPERGTRRDELAIGLRTFGYKRRVTIVFRIIGNHVEIVRVLYGGRDIGRALRGRR